MVNVHGKFGVFNNRPIFCGPGFQGPLWILNHSVGITHISQGSKSKLLVFFFADEDQVLPTDPN